MDTATFQQLVVPGARIRFGDLGQSCDARVRSCHWRREYVTVHLPLARNPQKVPAWAITDVPPDLDDIDSVEEWLARGSFENPYQRPLRGPLTSFYIKPDGTVSMAGNTDRGLRGVRPSGVVHDEVAELFGEAQRLGMFERSNRQIVGIETS